MKIEGSAFRLGGGGGLANRGGGVSVRRFGMLFDVLTLWFLRLVIGPKACVSSVSSSSAPSLCGRVRFGLDKASEALGPFAIPPVFVLLDSGTLIALFALPSVSALNRSSLSKKPLSVAGLSCLATARGGLAIRGTVGCRIAMGAEVFCRAKSFWSSTKPRGASLISVGLLANRGTGWFIRASRAFRASLLIFSSNVNLWPDLLPVLPLL